MQTTNDLSDMKHQWASFQFAYRFQTNSGLHSITNLHAASELIDAQLQTTARLLIPKDDAILRETSTQWTRILEQGQQSIEEWSKMQAMWMYLQPIMSAPALKDHLASAIASFHQAEQQIQTIMGLAQSQSALDIVSNPDFTGMLQKAGSDLEFVQRDLSKYLDQLKYVFGRLNFVSDDELCEVVCSDDQVQAIRPYLKNMFEGIADLGVQSQRVITSMISPQKQHIQFGKQVKTNCVPLEAWLSNVESQMSEAVESFIKKCLHDFPSTQPKQWALQHPAQAVLLVSQIEWVKGVEQALQEGNLEVYLRQMKTQLKDWTELIREELTASNSIVVNALIVQYVHALDVVDGMVAGKVTDLNDFKWAVQVRHYMLEDRVTIRCGIAQHNYGNEFIGNTPRLVITPLTDRGYFSILEAIHCNQGAALNGPAGTGKTETAKDLSKNLGKHCVVYQGSDQVDYLTAAKLFRGIASTGAWVVIDEINRLDIEVLAVLATQFETLFNAKAYGMQSIDWYGSQLKIDPNFAIIFSQNPGYAGRTQMDGAIKKLFRNSSFMVPDYALIAEIMLYSQGFMKANELSRKMVNVFKMLAEQCSSQDHYDFGMRALKSVISHSGHLFKKDYSQDESKVVIKSLLAQFKSKFLHSDCLILQSILQDIFPGYPITSDSDAELKKQLLDSCSALNNVADEHFLQKLENLHSQLQIRHSVGLIGQTGTCKSEVIKTLHHALCSLANQPGYQKVNLTKMNAKSVTMDELYGTNEGADVGILPALFQRWQASNEGEAQWVVNDGPIDALWVESLNSVMDDNKRLILPGLSIALPANARLLFEIQDAAVMSPASVSRMGFVYTGNHEVQEDMMLHKQVGSLHSDVRDNKPIILRIQSLVKTYVSQLLAFQRHNCSEPVPTNDFNIIQSLFRVLESQFKGMQIDQLLDQLEPMFIQALTWSVCCTTDQQGRDLLNVKLRQMLPEAIGFPKEGDVFDYCWDASQGVWKLWQPKDHESVVPAYGSQFYVPTMDSVRMQSMMKSLVCSNAHVLTPGPCSTGKTLNISHMMTTQLPAHFETLTINFTPHLSLSQIKDAVLSKVEKKHGSVFGPKQSKRLLVFLEDMNLEKKEEYGAQKVQEMIRQLISDNLMYRHGHHGKHFTVEDVQFISSIGLPGPGRPTMSQRLTSKFNMLTYTDLNEANIQTIFQTVLSSRLTGCAQQIQQVIPSLVASSSQVHTQMKSKFKPTCSKPTLNFSLRQVSNVMQGLASKSPKPLVTTKDLVATWIHESMREYADPMNDLTDQKKVQSMLLSHLQSLGCQPSDFTTFHCTNQKQTNQKYGEDNYSKLNSMPDHFALFGSQSEHVCRIKRIIESPGGHALLVGPSGTGKSTAARHAVLDENLHLKTILDTEDQSVSNWKSDVRKAIMQAGTSNEDTVLMMDGCNLTREYQWEDLCNIINATNLLQLCASDDLPLIQSIGENEGKTSCFEDTSNCQVFLDRVKAKLHLVIIMDADTDNVYSRLQNYPSLATLSTDWFGEWQQQDLVDIASKCLSDQAEQDEGGKQALLLSQMHQKAREMKCTSPFNLLLSNFLKLKQDFEIKVTQSISQYDEVLQVQDGGNREEIKSRYQDLKKQCQHQRIFTTGHSLLAASKLTYLSSLPSAQRSQLVDEWKSLLNSNKVQFKSNWSICKESLVESWREAGLTSDADIQNALAMHSSNVLALIVDPDHHAMDILKTLSENNLLSCDQNDPKIRDQVAQAVEENKWVVIPHLTKPSLVQQLSQVNGKVFGIVSSSDLHLFRGSVVINLSTDSHSLQHQILNQIIRMEFPQLQVDMNKAVDSKENTEQRAKEVYQSLQPQLHKNEGEALDQGLVLFLQMKEELSGYETKCAEVTKMKEQIMKSFQQLAEKMTQLYTCLQDIHKFNSVYSYSLHWFLQFISQSMAKAPKSDNWAKRAEFISDQVTREFYQTVGKALFSSDKAAFTFLVAQRIGHKDSAIAPAELQFLLSTLQDVEKPTSHPVPWLGDFEWQRIYAQMQRLETVSSTKGLMGHFLYHHSDYKSIYESTTPFSQKLPSPWEQKLTKFQKLMVIKALRPDCVEQAIAQFVSEAHGLGPIDSFDLESALNESSAGNPILVIHQEEASTLYKFMKLAKQRNMEHRAKTVCMGQGQGQKVAKAIQEAKTNGEWILVQNLHHGRSWAPNLKGIYHSLSTDVHPDFRLWISTQPADFIPAIVLQQSIKVFNEPAQGLKNRLLHIYERVDDQELHSNADPNNFKQLYFAFSMILSILQERVTYGPQGMNQPYEFLVTDLISLGECLKSMINSQNRIPFEFLQYTVSEVHFGQQVRDDKDRRFVSTLCKRFIVPGVLESGFQFDSSGLYHTIQPGSHQSYLDCIQSLPDQDHPEILGFDKNALFTKNRLQSCKVLAKVLKVQQPRDTHEKAKEVCQFIEKKLPSPLDFNKVVQKYAVCYEESLNQVLQQEVFRYNRLIGHIKGTVSRLMAAIEGRADMDRGLKEVAACFVINQIPPSIHRQGYPTLLSLSEYLSDLCKRVEFMRAWVDTCHPTSFWLPALFFPKGLITALKQNYCRKNRLAFNQVEFELRVKTEKEQSNGPEITGICLQGAEWNPKHQVLDHSSAMNLFLPLPTCVLAPKEQPSTQVYSCPLYKTTVRQGVLSTTGHSTNFVCFVSLPVRDDPAKFLLAGAAGFLNVDN